jgi:predicted heme/steroid binding protein
MGKTFAVEEIGRHSTEDDCWIIVDGKVYDVTKFLQEHPGGKRILLKVAGQDATKEFHSLHAPEILDRFDSQLRIGDVEGSVKQENAASNESGERAFGALEPFAEPYWYNPEFKSPYYNQSHCDFRAKVRAFIEKEVAPNLDAWEEAMDYPSELHQIAYKAGGRSHRMRDNSVFNQLC